MEARNVKIYKELKNPNSNIVKFYNFYIAKIDRLDMSLFLDSIADFEDTNKENNKVYGIINNTKVGEYDVILTFINSLNLKKYILFTDNRLDGEKKLAIYCAIYDDDLPQPFIGVPQTKEELDILTIIMDSLYSKAEI